MPENEQMLRLSVDVLHNTRNSLLVHLRFLDAALSRLTPLANDIVSFGTDGRYLAYQPKTVLKRYVSGQQQLVYCYLHSLLHCVFRHPFVNDTLDHQLWDLACDIAAAHVIGGLHVGAASHPASYEQEKVCSELAKKLSMLTAEHIYRHFLEHPPSGRELLRLESIFQIDDHRLWYMTEAEKRAAGITASPETAQTQPADTADSAPGQDPAGADMPPVDADVVLDLPDENAASGVPYDADAAVSIRDERSDGDASGAENMPPLNSPEDWKDVSERMQIDLETFSQMQGDEAGRLVQALRELNRERYDYTAFLKKFAVIGEAMKINDDEFDYIFYTYGLRLYQNMPLIEPLEYKEVKRIREFVIAIDTSGSVAGEQVQTFLQKTYNIMQQTDSFFSKINLHIIQCDSKIQEHVKITSKEDFEKYLAHMQIRGLGGTDFRPVFRMVDALCRSGEFTNLKGLIYFTDGYGTFPERKPFYETAFIFVEQDCNDVIVPPWAIRLVLRKDELSDKGRETL